MSTKTKEKTEADQKEKICFVMMPISDVAGYDNGHFARVYQDIIGPAIEDANFKPDLVSDIRESSIIIVDILRRIIDSEMAVCDTSTRNPNVFYELGLRQAFDKPVTFIKDDRTERPFDTQIFRDVTYHSSLRYDLVLDARKRLAESINATYDNKEKRFSIIEQLQIRPAEKPDPRQLNADSTLILKAINNLSDRLGTMERGKTLSKNFAVSNSDNLQNGVDEFLRIIKSREYSIGQEVKILGNHHIVEEITDAGFLVCKNSQGKLYGFDPLKL